MTDQSDQERNRLSVPATGSKGTSSAQELQEVEKIVEELKEKYAASYGK